MSAVSRRRFGWLATGLVALAAPPAGAGDDLDEIGQWIPSLGGTIGLTSQTLDGFLQNDLRPPVDPNDPGAPGPGTPSSGDDMLLDPAVGASFELMTPGLALLPGRPRLFAHGDFEWTFASSVGLVREGAPGPFSIPPVVPANPGETRVIPALAIGNQGARTEAELGSVLAGAGAGVALTLDLGGRRLRVKPSVEYLFHRVRVSGIVRHVAGRRVIDDSGQFLEDFTFFTLRDDEERTFHSLGGGLELEMDTIRLGPFVTALFLRGQVLRIMGDRDFELSASDGTNTARWSAEVDPTLYRAQAGLRFRYLPDR